MNATTREHEPFRPDSRRGGRVPTSPSGRLPQCEGCAEAEGQVEAAKAQIEVDASACADDGDREADGREVGAAE